MEQNLSFKQFLEYDSQMLVEQEFNKGESFKLVPSTKKLRYSIIDNQNDHRKKDNSDQSLVNLSKLKKTRISQVILNFDKISNHSGYSINENKVKTKTTQNVIENKSDSIKFANLSDSHSQISQNGIHSTIDINENLEELNKNLTLHKLVFDGNEGEIASILNMFTNSSLLYKLVNHVDLRGNTPLLIAIIQRQTSPDEKYSKIIDLLLKHQAEFRIKNNDNWSPADEAIFNKDKTTLKQILEEISARRLRKFENSKEKIAKILNTVPDFYLEMKWEFDSLIPFLSSFAPSDICKIWKIGENLRMDFTFADFRSLKVIRIPKSYIFTKHNDVLKVFVVNSKDNNYHNPFEVLEEDEKEMIVEDILNTQRVNGDFTIKSCEITESTNIFGNKNFDKINEWNSQKFDVKIKSCLLIQNKEKIKYKNFNKHDYFNPRVELKKMSQKITDKDLKENILKGLKVKNESLKKELYENMENSQDKKLNANVWITNNFPIKLSYLISLISTLEIANENMTKINDFFKHKDVRSIIETNGFPVQIKIPITFFLDVKVTFCKFRDIDKETENVEMFKIPENCVEVSRKIAMDLKGNEKRRFLLANLIM